MIAVVALGIVLPLMLVELRISQANERVLLGHGACAPPDPVYTTMRLVYPGTFVAMTVENGSD